MNASTKKENLLNSGLSGRLHRWAKNEHAVGLDVNDGQIVASHFTGHNGGLLLDVLAMETVNPALSRKELAHCIRTFWKKHKLPTRTVCTSLHSPSTIARPVSYTNVLEDELPRVLSLEAEEALQLPPEEISLSWHLNPAKQTGEISGALIAAPRKTVRNHIKLIQMAGLYPINVEIDCSAVINLYDFLNPTEDPLPVCIINLTSQIAGIVILANGAAYPRIVFSGNKNGWQDNLDYLIANVESALLHYQLKVKGDPVSKLILTGHPLPDKAMNRFIEAMSISVERWSPASEEKMPSSDHLKKMLSPEEMTSFNLSTALGLGLRHPKREL
jgi:hypothetical protein